MADCKKIVITEKAPKAIGPYSVGIVTEQFVFTSGQIGLDPLTGDFVVNLEEILKSADSCLNCVVKTTVFLKDMNDFGKMNTIYAEFFKDEPPARSAIQVAALPKGALVEIEAVAKLCCDSCDCS